ncbi:MAG: sugar transferase [bacterium]|nr:sugar transferase [bacterium]
MLKSLVAMTKNGSRGSAEVKTLVLGTGERARKLADSLESASHGGKPVRVVGFLDDDPAGGDREALGDSYLGRLERLTEIARREAINWVVYGLPRRFLADDATANAIGVCETLGIDVTIPVDLFDTRAARIVRSDLNGIPAIDYAVRGHYPWWKLGLKRLIDVAGAAALLIATLPLWLAVALAIKLDSPGPVIFTQKRCGLRGRVFPCLKFRTMTTGAEQQLEDLQSDNELSGPVFKIRNDPRITRVGSFLRKFSIDELPQLLNVIYGQMSLVGPRPPVPGEVESYEIDHYGRLSMRPGLTCLWQVSGRNEIEFEDWVKLDLEYVERWSLLLDLQILVATLPAVISARGAS